MAAPSIFVLCNKSPFFFFSQANAWPSIRTWRSDGRCGRRFPVNGRPGECNPASGYPCCSKWGYCGLSTRGLRVAGWSVGSIRVGFAIKTRDLGSGSITVILDHFGRVFSDFYKDNRKNKANDATSSVYDYYLRFLSVAWLMNHFSTFLVS